MWNMDVVASGSGARGGSGCLFLWTHMLWKVIGMTKASVASLPSLLSHAQVTLPLPSHGQSSDRGTALLTAGVLPVPALWRTQRPRSALSKGSVQKIT